MDWFARRCITRTPRLGPITWVWWNAQSIRSHFHVRPAQMIFDELIVLLPCHSLDDFPTNLKGEDAEGVLAGWSALWQPALLATVGKMPTWRAAEFSSDSLTGKLIVVPPVVEKTFAGDLETRAQNEGACLIRGLHRREE